jgi:hypothetical protein
MPAFDRYHALVVRVLTAAGWTIVGEQVLLAVDGRNLWIDIEANLPQSQTPVLIEVKTFEPSGSIVEYLGCATGKYGLYRAVMERLGIDMHCIWPFLSTHGMVSLKKPLDRWLLRVMEYASSSLIRSVRNWSNGRR